MEALTRRAQVVSAWERGVAPTFNSCNKYNQPHTHTINMPSSDDKPKMTPAEVLKKTPREDVIKYDLMRLAQRAALKNCNLGKDSKGNPVGVKRRTAPIECNMGSKIFADMKSQRVCANIWTKGEQHHVTLKNGVEKFITSEDKEIVDLRTKYADLRLKIMELKTAETDSKSSDKVKALITKAKDVLHKALIICFGEDAYGLTKVTRKNLEKGGKYFGKEGEYFIVQRDMTDEEKVQYRLKGWGLLPKNKKPVKKARKAKKGKKGEEGDAKKEEEEEKKEEEEPVEMEEVDVPKQEFLVKVFQLAIALKHLKEVAGFKIPPTLVRHGMFDPKKTFIKST